MQTISRTPHTGNRTTPVDFAVLEQAANWYAILQSPDASKTDMQHWQTWRDTCDAHLTAWQRVEAISGKFNSLPEHGKSGAHAILDKASPPHRTRRKSLKILLLLCTTGTVLTGGGAAISWHSLFASHKTGTGERREERLADGSSLWLNTDTVVDVRFTDTERTIILHRGEILINTAKEADRSYRPLVVHTDFGKLQALGTHFNVYQQEDGVKLSVFDGAVKVTHTLPAVQANIVLAGQQTHISATGIAPTTPVAATQTGWTRGLIFADNITLGQLANELSRYRTGVINVDPGVADIRVIGVYNTSDTDQVLSALAGTLPIKINHTLPWWVSIVAP